MKPAEIAKSLHRLERNVLPHIAKPPSFEQLVEASKLQEVEVMRALQWLSNKKLIELKEQKTAQILLSEEAQTCIKEGLPERRFLNSLSEEFQSVDTLVKKLKLSAQEVNIAIGMLKKKAAVDLQKTKGLEIKITKPGVTIKDKEWLEETFLKSSFPKTVESLSDEEKFSVDILKKTRTCKRRSKKANLYHYYKRRQRGCITSLNNIIRRKAHTKHA